MATRIVFITVILGLFVVVGGFVALAAWDVQIEQTKVEKTLDQNRFLNKN